MEYRELGASRISVSALSLGSWNTYERLDFDDAVSLVRRALDAGVNFFDVSRYSHDPKAPAPKASPHTESIVGKILDATGVRRHEYVISEKMWYDRANETLAEQLDKSLHRLGTEYADVVCCASPEVHGMTTGELVETMTALIDSGRARTWGAGNWSPALIGEICEYARRHRLASPVMVQQKYNVARRAVVEDPSYVETSKAYEVSLHAADTLEGGVLVGRDPARRQLGRDPGGIRAAIQGYSDRFRAAAAALDASPGQLALAYVLKNPLVASAVVGVTQISQLDDNLGAFDLLKRTSEDDLNNAVEEFRIREHVLDPY